MSFLMLYLDQRTWMLWPKSGFQSGLGVAGQSKQKLAHELSRVWSDILCILCPSTFSVRDARHRQIAQGVKWWNRVGHVLLYVFQVAFFVNFKTDGSASYSVLSENAWLLFWYICPICDYDLPRYPFPFGIPTEIL